MKWARALRAPIDTRQFSFFFYATWLKTSGFLVENVFLPQNKARWLRLMKSFCCWWKLVANQLEELII